LKLPECIKKYTDDFNQKRFYQKIFDKKYQKSPVKIEKTALQLPVATKVILCIKLSKRYIRYLYIKGILSISLK
jgi:hypothetical protein